MTSATPRSSVGCWGVDSDTTRRKDGYQFEGRCNRARDPCDNNGDCSDCRDDNRYGWKSFTSRLRRFAPPNEDSYNHKSDTEQQSRFIRANVHASGSVDLVVSCPTDTDGDFYADEGGCMDLRTTDFGNSGHQMDQYELDHNIEDDFAGRLRSPTLDASVSSSHCNIYGYWAGRDGTDRSKYPNTSMAEVPAKAATRIVAATFDDAFGSCCDPLNDPECK